LIVSFGKGCTTSCWYHGGTNMHGSHASHLYDPKGGFNGGPLGGFPLGELPSGESLSCPPSGGWWSKPLVTWACKLMLIYTLVELGVVTCCWTCPLSLSIIGWTTIETDSQ
jgi:hypothetical protein